MFVYNREHNKCPLEKWGFRYSGVSNVLKSIEKQLGLSEMSVTSLVSAVEAYL